MKAKLLSRATTRVGGEMNDVNVINRVELLSVHWTETKEAEEAKDGKAEELAVKPGMLTTIESPLERYSGKENVKRSETLPFVNGVSSASASRIPTPYPGEKGRPRVTPPSNDREYTVNVGVFS